MDITESDSKMAFTNLEQVRVVMVHTSHPGNIGAAARAMKTMGFRHLVLVQPRDFPSATATAMASGATDLLDSATVVETLQEAIADCALVVGASARSRTLPWPLVNPREMAQQVLSMPDNSQVALVLGRERSGLTNDELACCHCHVNIPANPDYSSLNVASAVQVLTYELRMTSHASQEKPKPHWGVPWDQPPANAGQLESLFQHWERVLVDIDFLNPNNPRTLMSKVRRLILRAQPDEVEANILRGMLSHVDKHLRKP